MNKKILLLGSGELGKELTISLKRLGCKVLAVDRYPEAPAMQVADDFAVVDMLNGKEVVRLCKIFQPDFIVPEIEAIRTEALIDLEKSGYEVIPCAQAAHITMNRDAVRDLASKELGLRTAHYAYADSLEELTESVEAQINYPCVIKPIMSSSGKGQSVAKKREDLSKCWKYAVANMRGDKKRVIAEEFIDFELEITLLAIRQRKGPTIFVQPIGHRQERGDYQESWIPAALGSKELTQAKKMARKITDRLGGFGLFGVEFFVKKGAVIFSELSPRPHDTGMVTLISQNLSEFDLHARAILGLPIPKIQYYGPAASAVILADHSSKNIRYQGISQALQAGGTELRIFGKPSSRKHRRMGVALAQGRSTQEARKRALQSASQVRIL